MIRKTLLTAAALACAMAMSPLAGAAEKSPFDDRQKGAIGEIVKEYLLEHPEVIQDALAELERRQKDAEKTATREAVAKNAATLTSSPRNIVVGNEKGDVTLVEFFDYNCAYCKKSLVDIREMMKNDPKLRVVIRDFPVLGPDSVEASMVALAVKNQLSGDRYFDFHQKLLESKGRVGKDKAMAVAKDLGVDMAKLSKDMENPEIRATLEETMRLADQLKLQGTPAFVVGDDVIFGAVGLEPLHNSVASVRQCGKATC
jgi:protein-disulfide isomerase